MDIEDGLTLNADTGAIALLEKSVQIRENYPEVDSDDPTKATSSKNRATPYTKPAIVKKTPVRVCLCYYIAKEGIDLRRSPLLFRTPNRCYHTAS
jgi:hypothetical protein